MTRIEIPLENVRVASPCRADWNAMEGDDRARFCGTCAKNVYNLSALSRAEAQNLIREHEGRLCVRFYQRKDGTMLTQDCPVGLGRLRGAALKPFVWLAVGASVLAAWGEWALGGQSPKAHVEESAVLMGDIAPTFPIATPTAPVPPPPPPPPTR